LFACCELQIYSVFFLLNRSAGLNETLCGSDVDLLYVICVVFVLFAGSNKATRVFSSSKYPSPEKESDYQSVFNDVPDDLRRPAPAKYSIQAKHRLPDEQVLDNRSSKYRHLDSVNSTAIVPEVHCEKSCTHDNVVPSSNYYFI
jgi:hypothetical protein